MITQDCADFFSEKDDGLCVYYLPGASNVGMCRLSSHFRCERDVKSTPFMMSHSMVQTFMRCPMRFWIAYVKGIQLRRENLGQALKMGIVWDTHDSMLYEGKSSHDLSNLLRKLNLSQEQHVKLQAMMDAKKEMVDFSRSSDYIGCQQEVKWSHFDKDNGEIAVHGYVDRLYEGHFVETKFSSRPDNYTTNPFKIASQVGTYFLCDEKLKYVTMEVARPPALRLKQGEIPSEYYSRIKMDIRLRPGYYFIGWNPVTRTYGKRFYREEFAAFIDSWQRRFAFIATEIRERAQRGAWYYNESACNMYGFDCEFLPICSSGEGFVSEKLYTMREKKIEDPASK